MPIRRPGCAYCHDDVPAVVPLRPSAKAGLDGDLVCFAWADYLAPAVVKGFREEYGVEVVQSNVVERNRCDSRSDTATVQ